MQSVDLISGMSGCCSIRLYPRPFLQRRTTTLQSHTMITGIFTCNSLTRTKFSWYTASRHESRSVVTSFMEYSTFPQRSWRAEPSRAVQPDWPISRTAWPLLCVKLSFKEPPFWSWLRRCSKPQLFWVLHDSYNWCLFWHRVPTSFHANVSSMPKRLRAVPWEALCTRVCEGVD